MTLPRFIVAATLLAIAVCPAYAQGGLFGATRGDVGGDKLNFTFQVAQGYDTTVPIDVPVDMTAIGVPSLQQGGGSSTRFGSDLAYRHKFKQVNLSGTASTAFGYFESHQQFEAIGHNASVVADMRVPKGNLRLEQLAAYSPSYLYQLFPVDSALEPSIPVNPDYQLVQNDSLSYGTKAALSFGRRTQLSLSGELARTDFEHQEASILDLKTYETSVGLARGVSARTRVSSGYTYTTSEFGSTPPTHQHAVTIGAVYTPSLSRTRRLELRAEVSPTWVYLPATAVDAVDSVDGSDVQPSDSKQFRVASEVSVSYPFRRNWRTTGLYRRSVENLSVIGQPVMSDAASVELGGLLARRVDVAGSAGYASVQSVYDQDETLDTYTAQVNLRYAVTRWAALSATYLYYYYNTEGGVALSPLVEPKHEQHGVRIGLVIFMQAPVR